MDELRDGETRPVRGSSGSVYELKNVGGVYSCSCPAWRNQSRPAHQRTCKHLTALRGGPAEAERLASAGVPVEGGPAGSSGQQRVTTPPSPAQGPPLLLAHSWDQLTDLTGWWMSEKLDGVRAYWDGQRLISRLGNPFVAPDWFVAGLPDHPLDGELWGGRRMFQRTVSIVRRQDASQEWRHIRYLVFDAPSAGHVFEERLEQCRRWLSQDEQRERFGVLEHQPCQGVDHLRAELARVEASGGEGLMLRRPSSEYEVGRSWTLLKVKSFHDAEATVVGYQPGEGRHRGRVGALLLELADGTRFAAGTGLSDAERESPPPLGSVVTFRYQELSNAGVPRFPTYVGARCDARPSLLTSTKPRTKEASTNMQVIQTALAEACDLNSQNAQERLGSLLMALHAYAGGSTGALQDYVQKYPFSRIKDALASPAPPKPSPPRPQASPPPSPPTPAPSPAAPVETGYRRFEFSEGNSSKFWEVAVDGCNQTVRYGRLGTAGQAKTKVFASEAESRRDSDKLIAEKVGKGYSEVGSE